MFPAYAFLLLLAMPGAAQKTLWFPKPVQPAAYRPPMKPLTRLGDLKAKHWGNTNWSELVIDDGNTKAWVISASPGSRVARHLFPDSPAWWVVQEGRIRFEVEYPENQWQVIEARKGSYVFVPERHLHSLEVIGDAPAIRLEVQLAAATPVWEKRPEGVDNSEIEYVPVRLSTGENRDDIPRAGGKPDRIHVNIEDLEAAHRGQSAWSEPSMRKNRVRGNFIYGHEKDNPKREPGYRGHFHADFAEFWIVVRGRLRWIMEGIDKPLIAGEGDIVYAPPNTFHIPEFLGPGPACRLTSSTYPGANHIFDAR
ncbi:MAG: cupin domain-containing protein [Acidobacteria bacterium]|nr:cupin domain-containing protein [Acidobacteriota bacterium]